MTSSRQDAAHSGRKASAAPPAAMAAEQHDGPLGRQGLVDRTEYIRLLEQVRLPYCVPPCAAVVATSAPSVCCSCAASLCRSDCLPTCFPVAPCMHCWYVPHLRPRWVPIACAFHCCSLPTPPSQYVVVGAGGEEPGIC